MSAVNVQCECGSQWWRLEGGLTEHGRTMGALAVDEHGEVTAYSGVLRCYECANEAPAETPRLRVVGS